MTEETELILASGVIVFFMALFFHGMGVRNGLYPKPLKRRKEGYNPPDGESSEAQFLKRKREFGCPLPLSQPAEVKLPEARVVIRD